MFNYKTTLDQLTGGKPGTGASKLKSILGANSFVLNNNTILFKFKGSKKTNRVGITLSASDDYILDFYKLPSPLAYSKMDDDEQEKSMQPVKTFKRIGVENLQSTFKDFTKLRTSL